MREPDMPPATTGDEEATTSADSCEHRPEVFAISPAIGPVPAIYVPQSPTEQSATGLLCYAEAEATRRSRSWAARHLPHHDRQGRAHESPAPAAPPTVPKPSRQEEQCPRHQPT
jgi:hypothetical protein